MNFNFSQPMKKAMSLIPDFAVEEKDLFWDGGAHKMSLQH